MTEIIEIINLAVLDCYRRMFPFKKVTWELARIGLRDDEAEAMIEDYLRRAGLIE